MPRPRSDIPERVVRAARARFLQHGVDGASLRAIAADAATSVGMVYYYFPTKDDLFAAVVEEVYAGFLDDLAALLAPPAPVAERMRRVFVRAGQASPPERDVLRLVVREALVSSTRLDRVIARIRRGHLPMLLAALAEGVEEGAIDPDLPLPLAMMITGAVGIAPQILGQAVATRIPLLGLPQGEELATILVDRLLRGIGPRASQRPAPLPTRRRK